jgi:lipopolysaccharide/colanic/teichoic acid biosynthesis glycosyltransferase
MNESRWNRNINKTIKNKETSKKKGNAHRRLSYIFSRIILTGWVLYFIIVLIIILWIILISLTDNSGRLGF